MCKLKRTNKEIALSAEEMELAIKKFLIDYKIRSDKKIVCFNSIESIGKYTIMFGATFTIVCDIISRSFTASEIPLSAVTGFLGTPIFIAILYARRKTIYDKV